MTAVPTEHFTSEQEQENAIVPQGQKKQRRGLAAATFLKQATWLLVRLTIQDSKDAHYMQSSYFNCKLPAAAVSHN